MFWGITVVAGPARCGKTARLLDRYREILNQQPIGSALWLSPTHRSAATIRQLVLADAMPGCFSPNCLTFEQYASRVLDASEIKARPLSLSLMRQILARLIDEALERGRLRYFAPIARTPGLLDLLVQFIQELKRLEIWPDELAAAGGQHATAKDRELCYLYGRYQEVLTEHDLYDAQGRFWSARAVLRDGQRRPFQRLRHVFVDGFTDFTRTEHEILEILAGRVDSLTISLPLQRDTRRNDLFAKSAKTLCDLQRRHPAITVQDMPRLAASWPAMAHLEEHLFANPRHAVPARDATGLEIIAAGGATHEIELLAWRIKKLLTLGDADGGGGPVRPGDILVVFRSLAASADLVREIFGQFGIPIAIGSGATLDRAPIMSALAAWLRLDLEDWPYRQLLAVLVHNYFRPKWPEWQQGQAVVAAEGLAHALQIPAGRAELLAGAERMSKRAFDKHARPRDQRQSLPRLAETALPLLARMAQALDALPQRATPSAWAAAVTILAEELGFFDAAEIVEPGRDRAAWQQLTSALQASEQLSNWIGQESCELSRREFFDRFQELLRSEPLSRVHEETGRVRVLPAESARNLSTPYVFLAGLSEKAFPTSQREDCITSEAETRQLVAAGLPLVSPAERSRFEMLLFYEMVTRATRRLVLSYPALDPAAQPLSPSPYLYEVEHACGPNRIQKTDQPDLSCVPAFDDAWSPRDFRVLAVAQALAGDASLLAELPRHPATLPAAENLVAGLQASEARQRGASFGVFEGMLSSAEAGRVLRDRYGPQRCWSPSELEQYASCPYQYFLSRVLHLEPLDEPALEVDYLGRGQMLHWLLSSLHRELNRGGGRRSPSELSPEAFLATVEVLLDTWLQKMRGDQALENGLLEIDARQVAAWLADYYRQHSQYDEKWRQWSAPLRPAHFEVAFGPSRYGGESRQEDAESEDEDTLSTRKPLELDCGSETIRFSGRIDRIDLGAVAGQAVFTIVDYKSHASQRTRAEAIGEGYSLQLPLYALAAQELLVQQQALPYRAAYWHVAGSGYREVIQFASDAAGQLTINPDWDSLQSQLRRRVHSLVEGIRGGEFPMHSVDEKCTSRCPYSTVCRVNQVRALGKTWEAPREASP